MDNKTKTVLLCGVGGQGTILAADLLAAACLAAGRDVKVSEIHGMAQRGGAVTTVVRVGERVSSMVSAASIARSCGNAKCANVVLVGALSAMLDIPADIWERIVAGRVPEHTVEANLAALAAGRSFVTEREGEEIL